MAAGCAMIASMPRDDVIGKLDVLRVAEECGRDGCYGLNRLISQRGRDAKLIDWLDDRPPNAREEFAQHE